MLDAIGIGAKLAGKGCEIRHIRVSDGLEPGALDFIPDADDGALGTMFENKLLRRAIHETANEAERVDLRMQTRAVSVERGPAGVTAILSDGTTVRAPCWSLPRVASRRRASGGIKVARWSYDHKAIISAFHHEGGAREYRVRDLLSQRPVRAAAPAR
jgi:2-octaprenyl-6-methoxyphenol hydroxylase